MHLLDTKFAMIAVTCIGQVRALDVKETLARLAVTDEALKSSMIQFGSTVTVCNLISPGKTICHSQEVSVASMSMIDAYVSHTNDMCRTHGCNAVLLPTPLPKFDLSLGADQASFSSRFKNLVTTVQARMTRLPPTFKSEAVFLASKLWSPFPQSAFPCDLLSGPLFVQMRTWLSSEHGTSTDPVSLSGELSSLFLRFELSTLLALAENHCNADTTWFDSAWENVIVSARLAGEGFLETECSFQYLKSLVSYLEAGDVSVSPPSFDNCLVTSTEPVSFSTLSLPRMSDDFGSVTFHDYLSFEMKAVPLPSFVFPPLPLAEISNEKFTLWEPGFVKQPDWSFLKAQAGYWADDEGKELPCPGFDPLAPLSVSSPLYPKLGLTSPEECLTTYVCRRQIYYPDGQGGCRSVGEGLFYDPTLMEVSELLYLSRQISNSDARLSVFPEWSPEFRVITAAEVTLDLDLSKVFDAPSWSVSFTLTLSSALDGSDHHSILFGVYPSFFVGLDGRGRMVTNVGGTLVRAESAVWGVGKGYEVEVVVSGDFIFWFRNGAFLGFEKIFLSPCLWEGELFSGKLFLGNFQVPENPLFSEILSLGFGVSNFQVFDSAVFPKNRLPSLPSLPSLASPPSQLSPLPEVSLVTRVPRKTRLRHKTTPAPTPVESVVASETESVDAPETESETESETERYSLMKFFFIINATLLLGFCLFLISKIWKFWQRRFSRVESQFSSETEKDLPSELSS